MTNLALGLCLSVCLTKSVALLPQIIHGSMLFYIMLSALKFRKSYIYMRTKIDTVRRTRLISVMIKHKF